jgi:preprotein translocase subunit YajC
MMDKKLFDNFVLEMFQMDVDQYNRLNQTIRSMREYQVIKMKAELTAGDRVVVNGGKRLINAKGTIKKVNKVKALVTIDGDGRTWNVPICMLMKI